MTKTMDEIEILSRIDQGSFVFKAENPEDPNDQEGFRSVVHVIRALERQGLVKVNSYVAPNKRGEHFRKRVDRVLVEYITRPGKMELRRRRATESFL